MRGDETKNIDVPSKVRAFRQEFPPDKASIITSFEVRDIAGAPAVIGHARVLLLNNPDQVQMLLAEAYATRGLRAPIPGAQGMKDSRDAERAMTGAVGRALFLMGYGDRPDDSADYEPDPVDWYKANGWTDQTHHDTHMVDLKGASAELPEKYRDTVKQAWIDGDLHWPLTREQAAEWERFLVILMENANAEDSGVDTPGAGDGSGDDPAPQPSEPAESVGPDAPFFEAAK